MSKVKRQLSEWEKITANETTDIRINFQNIQAAHTTQYQKKKANPIKKWEKDLNRLSPKKTHRWLTNM